MTTDSLKEFVAKLRNRLRQDPHLAERITAEVEDHLAESAHSRQSQGLSAEDAAREAIARFGDPEEIARTFDLELRSEPSTALHLLLTLLGKLMFKIPACYAAASFLQLVLQWPVLLITLTTATPGRLEFRAGLPTLVPETLQPSPLHDRLYPFWFVIHPALILLCILLSLYVLHYAARWFKIFLTYLIVHSSVWLILLFLPFVAWDGGDFGRRICAAFPSLCGLQPALRVLMRISVGVLLLLANARVLRSLFDEHLGNSMSQLVELAIWIMPIAFITVMVSTWFFQRWNFFVEGMLTVTFLLIILSGLAAILLSRTRRAVA
jgi:hypothetical protein